MDNMKTAEMISALADGQLQGEAFAHGVEAAAGNEAARETWHTYHLIGDVLRSGDYVPGTVPAAFLGRLQRRLQGEQAVAPAVPGPAEIIKNIQSAPAANDTSFRWKVVAGFASLAAVAAVGWTVVGSPNATPEQGQMAAVPPGTVLADTQRGVMIRDARLDEFMAAHRQLGGASALQMPAGFLRNATFEGPIR
jgi:sigma-E factor negative regulatory protein RseA